MKKFFILCALLLSHYGFSQKSAPVTGDAATLIDLLRKDYSTLNPETRDQEILTDRSNVISILRNYAELNTPITATDNAIKAAYLETNDTLKILNLRKETLKTINAASLTLNVAYNAKEASIQIDSLNSKIKQSETAYYYLKYGYDILQFNRLDDYFSNNAYLRYITSQFTEKYVAIYNNFEDIYAHKNTSYSTQKSLVGTLGGMTLETVIDALSRVIIEKAKQELTLYAVEKIKNYLQNPKPDNYCYELLAVMPSTTTYIRTFKPTQVLNFPNQLKQHIEEDLNKLPENALNLRNTPKIQEYLQRYPDLEFAFEGLSLLSQLSQVKNPVDYFEILENSRALRNWTVPTADYQKFNIAQSIRLITMIAYSLTLNDNNEPKFVSVDYLTNYSSEPNFYLLYIGMLHQQHIKFYNIQFKNAGGNITDLDLKTIMSTISPTNAANVKAKAILLKQSIIPIVQHAEKIYTLAMEIKKKNKNNESISFDTVHDFAKSLLSFSEETAVSIDQLRDNIFSGAAAGTESLQRILKPYFAVAHTANDIALDLHQKKYSNAITKAAMVPDLLYKNNIITADRNMLSIGATISGFARFVPIQPVFDLDYASPTLPADVAALNAPLVAFSAFLAHVKFANLNLAITNFNTYSTGPAAAITPAQTKIEVKTLADAFRADAATLMNDLNISDLVIKKSKLEKILADAKIDAVTIAAIKTDIEAYGVSVFNHILLHEPLNSDLYDKLYNRMKLLAPDLVEYDFKQNDNKLIAIINFLNEIAAASDQKAVETAISNFTDPAGSSSLKDSTSRYFSINTFPGALLGLEISNDKKNASFAGFTVPVGIYMQPWQSATWGSLGIYLSIIDIAAPVRFRLDDDHETENLPDFNFSDIFSPGFYLSYGLPKSPFAFNIGLQYGPKLRNIPNGASFKSVDSYRIGLGVVLDVPLFTLFNRDND